MEAKLIDLAEWEYFGTGGSGKSYTKKVGADLVLKLNDRDIPVETTEKEYIASKLFNEAGFPSPVVYDFVTDGERYGYTSQRIKGKLSFARMLSQEPENIDSLAARFASMARELHGRPADMERMTDAREQLLKAVGDLSFVPGDVADALRKSFSLISGDKVCLHGDMNPGNVISYEGKDFWIGVNEFSYGDSFLDIATMHILCYFLPAKLTESLYHMSQSCLKQFFRAFKKAYFGAGWDSKEIEAHIAAAATVKFCAAASVNPDYMAILIPLVRGQKLKTLIIKQRVARRCRK